MSRERSDRVAAWATGSGMGFLALMVTWLLGNRLTALVWDPPVGPTLAFIGAAVVGFVTALVGAKRLARRVTAVNRDGAHAPSLVPSSKT